MVELSSITLTNFMSYVHETIFFKKGINALAGDSGAGKSTVIRGIGLALFGYNDYPLKDLVRYGATSASIALVLSGGHRIVRGIGQGAYWRIYGPDGTPLTKTMEEVPSQIKEILGLHPSLDLAHYWSVISFRQLKISDILAEGTPSERKKRMEKILGVDKYQQVWYELRSIPGKITERLGTLQTKKEVLEERQRRLMEDAESLDRYYDQLVLLRDKADAQTAALCLLEEELVYAKGAQELRDFHADAQRQLKLAEAEVAGYKRAVSTFDQIARNLAEHEEKLEAAYDFQAKLKGMETHPQYWRGVNSVYQDAVEYLAETGQCLLCLGEVQDMVLKGVSALSDEAVDSHAHAKHHTEQVQHMESLVAAIPYLEQAIAEKQQARDNLHQASLELKTATTKLVSIKDSVCGAAVPDGSLRDVEVVQFEINELKPKLVRLEEKEKTQLVLIEQAEQAQSKAQQVRAEIAAIEHLICTFHAVLERFRTVREAIRQCGPRVAERLIKVAAYWAAVYYRGLWEGRDSHDLILGEGYSVTAVINGEPRVALSEGERTTAAIAFRLGIVKALGPCGLIVSDEITQGTTDQALGLQIPQLLSQIGGQVIVIDHSDLFDEYPAHKINISILDGTSEVRHE